MRSTLSVFWNAAHTYTWWGRSSAIFVRNGRSERKLSISIQIYGKTSSIVVLLSCSCLCVHFYAIRHSMWRATHGRSCAVAIYCNSIFLFRSANHAIFYLPLELRATRLTSVSRDRYINCCYLSSQKTNWTKTDIVWIWSGSNLCWPGPKILKRKRAQRWHKECPLVV